jgi:hypothetical protein
MVLVTNIYGEAAQLEETVNKTANVTKLGFLLHRCQGWVRQASDWLTCRIIHRYCQGSRG